MKELHRWIVSGGKEIARIVERENGFIDFETSKDGGSTWIDDLAHGHMMREMMRLKAGWQSSRPLNFDGLREANVARCEDVFHPLGAWSPTDWATVVGGECGEALNLVKKRRRGDDVGALEIAAELADLIIYTDLLAARLGIDLGHAVRSKFNEVSEKKGSSIFLVATKTVGGAS